MNKYFKQPMGIPLLMVLLVSLFFLPSNVIGQRATVPIPIGIGNPCNSTSSDSVKYFDYNSTTNILTHRSNCKPILAAPGFSDNLATITFNPYDGYLYFTQIALVTGIYNSYTYRWLPTTCPNPATLPVYKTFLNQFVASIEFDPATGLGYQVNFVDTTGVPASSPDVTNNVGQYSSGAIVNGRPAIAYYDVTNGDLRFVRSKDAEGRDWNTAVAVTTANNIGQYVSMIIVNGNPAISYYDVTNGDLKYVRATDINGTAWAAPVSVESLNNIGQYTSMSIVNGNPAISYFDVTNNDLRYVRATDASGTAWGTPVAVATAGTVGQYTSLKVVGGNPAIAYYDVANGDIIYVRSSDASGTSWTTPVTVESANNIGQYASMEIINGNPAISYFDVTNNKLRYVRATSATGTTWGTPLAVSATGTIGSYTSLKVVNGNPAVSFYDIGNSDLKYVRASDINGTAWAASVTPEATGNLGQNASMIIANGNPAICYYDVTNGNVKYIRSYDVNGMTWFRNSTVYNMELQEVNFTTGVLGVSRPIDFGNRYIYKQNGDVVMTPRGQLLGAFNNKYFTINWKDYATATPLVATYIDTLVFATGSNLVGLSYSDGKLVASIKASSACASIYREIDILTGAQSNITYNAGPLLSLFTSSDMTNITSGIGAAKRLISATENPIGSGTYDIEYEVIIENYGTTPVTNVQAYDTLNKINGIANVLSGSITSFSAPAGFTANTAFDGKTAGNFNLLVPGGTLSNIPGQNRITLRITCKISNILPGVVYNNQVAVTAVGLFGDAIRDLSTDGITPDRNNNDKPDDVGESQPTPLLISVVAQTPPCASLTKILFSQDFGTGTGLASAPPAPIPGVGVTLINHSTGYSPVVTQPISVESFTMSNNANSANTSQFVNLTDHTGNTNGRMFIINADASNGKMYSGSFTYPMCPKQQYSITFYAAFLGNAAYSTFCSAFGGFKYSKIKVRVRDGATGLIITEVSTADITTNSWQQYGLKFVSPASYASIIFELFNDAPGGCGNDIALDDIQFGSCDPIPFVGVNAVAGCLGDVSTFTGGLSDPAAIPGTKDYQWQVSTLAGGPWVNILGATSATYTINPVMPADTGKYYRLLVSAQGNIANVNCRFNSPGTKLTGKIMSVIPTTANKNKDNICAGLQVTLSTTGGSLGTNANWNWYDGSCAGTLLGTGSTLNVLPAVTTTYYVKAIGDCNTTLCRPVTIFINCDIDKDDDGIPDYVESYMAAALLDHNANGVSNAFDLLYPGYVDYNNDHINDNFQADGDSDNDGILNYLDATFAGRIDVNGDGVDDRFDMDLDGIINMLDLDSDNDGITDVVEGGGVDADGDGHIDNYSDTDNDGFSQNVDGNNTGARISGIGLGLLDYDADSKPNAIDLDSDGDGIPDVVEAGGPDTNNNAKIDGFVDVNGDGLIDSYINVSALLRTGADINADGKADSYPFKNFDGDKKPNAYDVDSDNDGIVDVLEAGFPDADYNGFADGAVSADGWNAALHLLPALGLRQTDADGKYDYLDIDSDGDGIPDNIEGQTTLSYKFPAYLDTDNDGLDNAYDLAPFTATFGGAGIFLSDKDFDNLPDFRDLDTDSDGAPDITEGHDYNLNGIADENVTPMNIDTDGDGLDDRFDLINSGSYLKGTSSLMGTGGSLTGDVSPGTSATVQKHTISQPERDWRYVTYVLPIQYLQLSSAENKGNVSLNWGVMTSISLDVFEIERSTDNIHFQKIGTQVADMSFDKLTNFLGSDNISNINSEIIFYRIKVIAKNGQAVYSNVVLVRKTAVKVLLSMYPNPAKDATSVSFSTSSESEIVISIKNNVGQTVFLQTQKARKGNNTIPLTNLNKFSNGVYSVQLMIENELVTVRLIIQN